MEETPDRTGNSGMSGLKVVFFFPLLPEEDIIEVVVDFFLFKRGGEAGKEGFQPMRKKLGEKFGVVFSFAVVVTDTELPTSSLPDALTCTWGRGCCSHLVSVSSRWILLPQTVHCLCCLGRLGQLYRWLCSTRQSTQSSKQRSVPHYLQPVVQSIAS